MFCYQYRMTLHNTLIDIGGDDDGEWHGDDGDDPDPPDDDGDLPFRPYNPDGWMNNDDGDDPVA